MGLPLSGLKVLDLSRALAGPYCGMVLADLGAEVIKIEPLPHGEMARKWGPIDRDISVYFLSTNRNKKDLAVNFRDPRGREVIARLAAKCDVVVENFKVGTMEQMGLGYDVLSAQNPRLIMGSISGFGRTGPASQWAGFDQIAQGCSGFMSITGMPETGPTRVGVPLGDLISGMWLSIAILAAVTDRQRTGKGQHVDTSLLAGLMSLLVVQGQRYLSLHEVPEPNGNAHPVLAPYGTFQTADGPLNLAPATEAMWVRLCELLGAPGLANDPRFIDNTERMRNRNALQEALEARLRTRTRAEWTPLFIENGIPAGPINNLKEAFAEAQVKAAAIVEEVMHPVLGALPMVGSPMRFSSDPEHHSVRTPAPALGAHTREVLAAFGVDTGEIETLLGDGVVLQG